MQNLWIKRCNCGKTAVEFRSRKDLFVDSVKHLYCPKCIKQIAEGSLVIVVKKWGSSTAKESDRGLYGILYNKEAIQRRNKGLGWDVEDIIDVFETGMVTPNLLSVMKDGIDFHILGVFKQGEKIADYKKKLHKVKDNVADQASVREFDGKFYDSTMEEPLDRIAGKLNPTNENVVDSEKMVNRDDDIKQATTSWQTTNVSKVSTQEKEINSLEDNASNAFANQDATQPSSPIFPNKSNG